MEKINLFWGIVWLIVFALCVLAMFWNPAHFFTAAISFVISGLFFWDYRDEKWKK